jgi:hypothetical protein
MKLIKINTDYYIVVDNSLDFSETDYYWDDKQKEIRTGSNNHVTGGYKIKITHSTQPLECDRMWTPVNGKQWMCNTMLCCGKILNLKTKPISLQEVKELIGEIDVEKKAEKMFPGTYIVMEGLDIAPAHREGFVTGYTQALEDNKEKKYTEAQLIWAIQEAYGHGQNDEFDDLNKVEKSIIVITNYLQPKTEWEVEIINGKLTLKQ